MAVEEGTTAEPKGGGARATSASSDAQGDSDRRPRTSPPVLTVIMPVYNERKTLPGLLERIRAVPIELNIVIVDDGSTDGTREFLQSEVEGSDPGVTVIYHSENRGKGAAIRSGIPSATGEYCIVQDGDLEYNPEDFVEIVRALTATGAPIVYGSRFLNGWPPMRLPNKVVNKLLAWMVRILYNAPMTDEATCYKAFRTDVLRSLPLKCCRFDFCPEVTAKALRRGHSIVEVPIRYEARSMSDGKKIRWTDGVAAIWTLLKYRFARF